MFVFSLKGVLDSNFLCRTLLGYSKKVLKCNIHKSTSNKSRINKTETNSELCDKLVKWAIQSKVSHITFSKLLKVLSECGLQNLPVNSKTLLLAKENETQVFSVPPGTYTHFGLEKNIKLLVSNLVEKNLFTGTDINVSVFIDQLPLVKFPMKGLWVILGSLEGFSNHVIFIGVYHGFTRPENSNLFLAKFIEEAITLSNNGVLVNSTKYSFRIKRLICDAPAKAFVLNFKDSTGYSSCTKCNVVGEFENKKVCFLKKSKLRKDKDFDKNEIYSSHKTSLLEIPGFGVVSNVTLDYMHLVCLGVMKKLLKIWLSDPKYWICFKSASHTINKLSECNPLELKRKPKSLKLFSNWSANDLRQFLLYYGPVVLRNNLKEKYLFHFLHLHVGCRLLCIQATTQNIIYSRNLFNSFVKNYKKLYCGEQITHNIHGLYHLADECSSHGTLDSFSAFPFEKFLLKLGLSMKKIRKTSLPHTVLKESYDKVFVRSLAHVSTKNFKLQRKLRTSKGDSFQEFDHYSALTYNNFTITPNTGKDSFVLLKNNKLIKVYHILKKKEKSRKIQMVAGAELSNVSCFHSNPFNDAELCMFNVGKVSEGVSLWSVDEIKRKCMKVPIDDEAFLVIGLLDENF